MALRFKHALMLGGSAAACAHCIAPAQAQTATALPEITVTAPSPIVRRKPAAPARLATPTTRTAPSAAVSAQPPAAEPQHGVLPVVTDQFATVTVVPNEEIRRAGGATLGDLLASKPGITGSSFAPGASSQPIIRGLDVNRVGMVENGIGSNGASDLGEDHFVPIDPLASNQIEVIRGPATLRYGSQSIGGVVSASNNRIPDALPSCAAAPFRNFGLPTKAPLASAVAAPCVTAETRTAISSADRGVESAVLVDGGGGNFAVHADAYGRKSGDYNVPSQTLSHRPNAAVQRPAAEFGQPQRRRLARRLLSVRRRIYWRRDHPERRAVSIPGIAGADHKTRIDAHQTKLTAKGEVRPDAAAIEAIRFWAGASDYKHNEIGLADIADPNSDGVRQTFTNKEQEGRVELQFAPFNVRFAALTTAVGLQASHQELSAPSPDNVGSPLNGLWDPNSNTKIAGYVFNELKFSDSTRAQIAGRIEQDYLKGTTPGFIADTFDLTANPADIGAATARNLHYTPKSGSIGLIQNLPWDLAASITAQYVERAPKPAELFSRGGHDATGTFDIGNPDLGIETAKSIEIGLRRATGPFRFEATAYYTKFSGFIYRRLTGNTCDDSSCVDASATALELNQAVYSQRDAIFRGGEFQSQLDVGAFHGGIWGIENQFDTVRATFADGSNVPRIPPLRAGGGLFWRDASWLARVNWLHAFAHNDIAAINETPTPGYNLLKAELSYTTKLDPLRYGAREMTLGIVGNNLLNENIRSSVSYSKDEVLMPGIGVRAFANLKF